MSTSNGPFNNGRKKRERQGRKRKTTTIINKQESEEKEVQSRFHQTRHICAHSTFSGE